MDPLVILLFLVLFVLSGFFSGTEIALMSMPSHKIDSLLKQNKLGSKSLKYIKSHNDKLLITILVGNNLVNVYAAALATQISISIARSSWIEESLAIWVSTWIITFLILLFGEIIPKSFATKNAEKISLLVSYPYKIMMWILFPVIIIIEFIIKIFTGKHTINDVTNDEISSFIDLGKDSGTLEDDQYMRLKNTLDMEDTYVDEIMTPRVEVEALASDTSLWEAFEYYKAHNHSRIPVFEETIDKIIGIVSVRTLLREIESRWEKAMLSDIVFQELIKVPINQPIDNLLKTFQHTHNHMAIVIDEYGWVAGIVTMEDILEEIVGEIRDENDTHEEEEIKANWKWGYIIDATVPMDDMLYAFKIECSNIGLDKREFDWETVSFLITHKLERFPEVGEEIDFPVIFETKDMDDKILRLKVLDMEESRIGDVDVRMFDAPLPE